VILLQSEQVNPDDVVHGRVFMLIGVVRLRTRTTNDNDNFIFDRIQFVVNHFNTTTQFSDDNDYDANKVTVIV
jgi:hypothetical protein